MKPILKFSIMEEDKGMLGGSGSSEASSTSTPYMKKDKGFRFDTNDEELIIEKNGDIRYCEYNIIKMGFWRSWKAFYSYRSVAKDLKSSFDEILDAFLTVFKFFAFLILFPVLPFIRAFFALNRAKKERKEEIEKTSSCD